MFERSMQGRLSKKYLLFGGILFAVVLVALAFELPMPCFYSSGAADTYFSSEPAGGLLDINTANAEELQLIEGIGPVKAQRILEYREMHGPFHSVEELALVEGISEKTVSAAKIVAVAIVP